MGSLHETNPSLWVGTTEPGQFPPLDGDQHADVVVVGAGITGLTTARLFAEQGASVIVIDSGSVCAGATGYTTAKATSLHGLTYSAIADRFDEDRARLYGQANEAAIAEIGRLAELNDDECGFDRRAHIVYTTEPSQAAAVAAEVEMADRLGLPVSRPATVDLPFDVVAAIRFDNQAQFHPRSYCLGLAAAIEATGGSVFAHTRARHIEDTLVSTDRGQLHAESVVVATHLPIKEMGGYFARTDALRSYAIAVTVAGERPENMYLSVDEPTRSLRTSGQYLIVGGEGHAVGEPHDTGEHYRHLEAWAREHFTVTEVAYRWSAQDWAAADGLPYIGRMPGHDHVYVATAFKKWGMTHGTVAAMLIRDMVAGRDNPWLEVYDSTRVAPKQSLRATVKTNLQTARHFVGDRLHTADRDAVDALRPGEGVIASVEGRPVAAYRDEAGALAAVSAVCTHLGCLVNFNPAERSWDCPCHGSRFAIDGAVLEGPAVDDLAPEVL